MVDCTGSHDDDILTEVVSAVEVCHHVAIDLPNVVNVTEDWLAHHVVPEYIEVDIFHESFLWVLISRLKLLPDGVFLHLQVEVIVYAVAKHVAEDLDGLVQTIRETQCMIKCMFAARVCIQLCASILDFNLELTAGSVSRSLEVQMLQKVSST